MNKNYKCFFDGACEPMNPGGKIGAGIYITDGVNIFMAFLKVLRIMNFKSDCKIEIFGDSMLVVNQMNDKWRIKHGAYRNYAIQAKEELSILKQRNEVIITWIPREQNEKADYQSMKAIGFERRKWK